MRKSTKKSEEEMNETLETAKPETNEVAEEILVGNEGKVGAILKQARLRLGKKIPEISQKLCIRKAYLEAIEESRYDSLPEMPYGLGFIRSYADYLGEDSAQIIRMYKDETAAKFNNDNKIYVLEPQTEATVPNKKYLLVSLLAIIAIYFLWFVFNNYHNSNDTEEAAVVTAVEPTIDENQFPLVVEDYAPVEVETALPVVEEAEPEAPEVIDVAPVEEVQNNQVVVSNSSFPIEAAPQKTEAGSVAAVQSQAGDKSNIVLKIKKETWVSVKNSDKLYISKVLQAGDTYTLPKAEGLILSVGRVDGVDVMVGGKLVNIINPNKKTNIDLDQALKNANH